METSSSQRASMLKEKAAFLQKHYKALFGKCFRDQLSESLYQKSNLSKQVLKLVNLPTERVHFERTPHYIKERQMGVG